MKWPGALPRASEAHLLLPRRRQEDKYRRLKTAVEIAGRFREAPVWRPRLDENVRRKGEALSPSRSLVYSLARPILWGSESPIGITRAPRLHDRFAFGSLGARAAVLSRSAPSDRPLSLPTARSIEKGEGLLTNSEVIAVLADHEADKQPLVSKAKPSEIVVRAPREPSRRSTSESARARVETN